MSYKIPPDVDEQTQQLVAAGIAARSLIELYNRVEDLGDVSVEMCRFWAAWVTDYVGGLQTRELRLKVVIQFPHNNPIAPYLVDGIVVTQDGSQGLALTVAEFSLVSQLAGSAQAL